MWQWRVNLKTPPTAKFLVVTGFISISAHTRAFSGQGGFEVFLAQSKCVKESGETCVLGTGNIAKTVVNGWKISRG